ncbi:MAG: hypothetical protein JWP12_2925 [Bacteroidetes bacterium]|nr:hypothetical protein [Bacteroidota bacterium]
MIRKSNDFIPAKTNKERFFNLDITICDIKMGVYYKNAN